MPTTRKSRRSPEEARAAREERLAETHQLITDYVESISSGEDWKRWLDVAARFHTYSPNNQLLIALQKPDATQIAGYNAWQDLGRQVRKGEKGITILAPVTAIVGWRLKSGEVVESEKPVRKTDVPPGAVPVRKMVGAKSVKVFDVAQTDGEPLPQRPIPDPVSLDGPAPEGMREGLAAIVAEHGFTLTSQPSRLGEDGYTDFASRNINITPGQSDAQAALTLAHEVGHMLMHDPTTRDPDEPGHHRGIGEVEAESVAYLIAGHFGYDTRDNSFPYVAGWAGQRNPTEVVRSTAEKVVRTAGDIIERIQPTADGQVDEQLHQRAVLTRAAAATVNEPHTTTETTAEPQPDTTQRHAAAPAVLLARQAAPRSPTTSKQGPQSHGERPTTHHTRGQQQAFDLGL
ncbi:ArdC-like ssDNA-binding domain-containing protein [Saccharopolyspora pogona]|uniref:ArdC-like ssDNA-binding domain-containing protein n=1 Tax=Saccharopolyspora pogona TaxID=333966 RepID=UPI001688C465|nr:ArdC-like ssDNA-binding domain-containing protein [Saccharopolyspora pogona]